MADDHPTTETLVKRLHANAQGIRLGAEGMSWGVDDQLLDEAADALDRVVQQRDEAIAMLADWCARVDKVGTGWDDWDEGYKDAAYRPCGIRELLNTAIAEAGKSYER